MAAVLAPTVAGTSHAATSEDTVTVVLQFADERITESSGLVDHGRQVLTVNDSGDGPVVYAVDRRSGQTTATVTYSDGEVADVEAMAPAGPGAVWVGDIGDNGRNRAFVEVYRVPIPPADGDRVVDARSFRLVYPDTPHDAETLLRHPGTGRLFVVTKWVTGGTVYAAPADLRAGTVNRLEAIGRVPGLVTGGAFLPDGRHLVLRTYSSARVFTFPGLEQVAELALPPQEQGEALAAVDAGTVLVSSEGEHSEVLAVGLPDLAVPPEPADAGTDAPTPAPARSPATTSREEAAGTGADGPGWAVGGIALVVLLGGLGAVLARRRSGQSRSTT